METENQMICGNPAPKAYKLKGKKTGKIKYLVVIDEENELHPLLILQDKKKKQIEQFLESRVNHNRNAILLNELATSSLALLNDPATPSLA